MKYKSELTGFLVSKLLSAGYDVPSNDLLKWIVDFEEYKDNEKRIKCIND